jgi:hypothetical protein
MAERAGFYTTSPYSFILAQKHNIFCPPLQKVSKKFKLPTFFKNILFHQHLSAAVFNEGGPSS